jgi:hypothetical protein
VLIFRFTRLFGQSHDGPDFDGPDFDRSRFPSLADIDHVQVIDGPDFFL